MKKASEVKSKKTKVLKYNIINMTCCTISFLSIMKKSAGCPFFSFSKDDAAFGFVPHLQCVIVCHTQHGSRSQVGVAVARVAALVHRGGAKTALEAVAGVLEA